MRNYHRDYYALSELQGRLRVDPGATRLALLGACPGYHIPRLWRSATVRPDCLPLLLGLTLGNEASNRLNNIKRAENSHHRFNDR